MGVSASGCHHNMSLWRGGKDVFHPEIVSGDGELPGMEGCFTYKEGGENTFMPDPKIDEKMPGPIGLNSIGGVIKHLPALTSIGSSTVNSYRRLWDTGCGRQFLLIGVIKTVLVRFVFLHQVVSNTVQLTQW